VKIEASAVGSSHENSHVRNSEPQQLIIRMGRPPLEVSYGSGPIGSITIAQKLRAPSTLPAPIIQELETLRQQELRSHDPRIRHVISEIFVACTEFDNVVISYPGGVIWESRRAEFPSAAA